jgi:predicted aspartyl protease
MSMCFAWIPLFFLTAGQQLENPWIARVSAAVHDAREQPTPEAYQKALDTAWRADNWQIGLELAQEALDKWPGAKELRALETRALWRAGRIDRAEELATEIPPDTTDRIGLRILIRINLSRGELAEAAREADRLAGLSSLGAEDLSSIIDVRLAQNRLAGLPEMYREAKKLVDPGNGYPETHLAGELGYAEYFEGAGSAPLNQVTRFGEADMALNQQRDKATCQVTINGHGPYSMLIDTGAVHSIWLDTAVAAEAGVKPIEHAEVHDIGSNKQESDHLLIGQVMIGEITCERVRAFTWESRSPSEGRTDGVLGTGIFADARITLDLAAGRLRVEPATAAPAAGREVQARIAGHCRLLAPVLVNGEPVIAAIDTGANFFALAPSLLKKLAPGREVARITGVATEWSTGALPVVKAEFAGLRFQACETWRLDLLDEMSSTELGIQTDVLLAMNVLQHARTLTVDYPHCRMWVQWADR